MRGRFWRPYWKPPFRYGAGMPGSERGLFCKEKGEWVEKVECEDCAKFGAWDGVNYECKHTFEWQQAVEENFRKEYGENYDNYLLWDQQFRSGAASDMGPTESKEDGDWEDEENNNEDEDKPDEKDEDEEQDDEDDEEISFEELMEKRKGYWWNRESF